ncbi:MAG: 16S rRNA (guanine(966)-N(2))-methyltransferase RsmD [Acholeplasmatales bacterium]|jgi:16S rRNA (guanine(966)-N(2))-methyltransferase RsmD|nr:16S rRNA (guanine(966)-N(2))-methyltransferase RsmD [Acholeplasmatales bacterium]
MRIIGGLFKSRIIQRVNLESTRETSDMVRQAVFNMLNNRIEGVSLDLFAGSGAYGLESISRGITKAYFCDNNSAAVSTIISNANYLKISELCIIKNLEYLKMLDYLENNKIIFDYIFLDPPYHFSDIELLLERINCISKKGTLIILERNKNSELISNLKYEIVKEKVYGIKKIVIYKKI